MLNHTAFIPSVSVPAGQHDAHSASDGADRILELARNAGMLITLDGQIGREKYQSIAGSIGSFMRFAEALRTSRVA